MGFLLDDLVKAYNDFIHMLLIFLFLAIISILVYVVILLSPEIQRFLSGLI